MSKIKYLSLFSGIGAFEIALKNEHINFELVNYCEIDKYASKSYAAVHSVSEQKNLWDVSKVNGNKFKNIDLITHGSPCQDFSNAGKGAGGNEGSKTRSSLMWQTVRIIEECNPKYVLWEQVPAILQQKHIHNFRKYNLKLDDFGYNTLYKVLNAKDFGLPQNRARVFVVSIRKDIDDSTFVFPKGFPLDIKLKDLLEEKVDKNFFLSQKQINNYISMENVNPSGKGIGGKVINSESIADTLLVGKGEGQKILLNQLGFIGTNAHGNRVYDKNGISTIPSVNDVNANNNVTSFNWKQSEGFKNKPLEEMTATLSTQENQAVVIPIINPERENVRQNGRRYKTDEGKNKLMIRKLTPLECWRLQGFSDEAFFKAKNAGISDNQLYKQAGNSVAITVLQHIFVNLLKNNKKEKIRNIVQEQQELF